MKGKLDKPSFEKITPPFGSSIQVKRYSDITRNKAPFWHFHPEMEIVYIKGGSGKRHIGNHLSYFQDGDLIFIGANLPHYGFTDRLTGNKSETVVQMKEDFMGANFLQLPELSHIFSLFLKARKGIVFQGKDKEEIGEMVEGLADCDHFERLVLFLNILNAMARAKEYSLLNVEGVALEIQPQDTDRMNTIYHYVRENFKENIPLETIADKVSMTVPAFCRYFKKMSNKTFTEFTNEYRLVHASKLLVESSKSISEICLESGFNNFSHFNKIFKRYHGKSPRDYRNNTTRLIGDVD